MYNGKHKSFKTVLWRAMKHPFCSDLSEEQAAEYALELIRRLKIPFLFSDTTKTIPIENYRGDIPDDLVYIRGMRYSVDDSFVKWLPVKYTGNIYNSTYHCDGLDETDPDECVSDVNYTINNNYIFLSELEGSVQLSYRGILLDDEGYPLIPDNQSFEDALYYYILKEHLFGLWTIGKVADKVYSKIEQEYDWAVGQASTSLKLAGVDHWESTMNGVRRLIQQQNFSDRGYKELHKRERIKKQF